MMFVEKMMFVDKMIFLEKTMFVQRKRHAPQSFAERRGDQKATETFRWQSCEAQRQAMLLCSPPHSKQACENSNQGQSK